jgi:hypothetical protein
LKDLVPAFLAEVPTDPFDGQSLRMLAKGNELVFYSVAKNRQDDGGVETGIQAQPDIVVQLKIRP